MSNQHMSIQILEVGSHTHTSNTHNEDEWKGKRKRKHIFFLFLSFHSWLQIDGFMVCILYHSSRKILLLFLFFYFWIDE
jgi:hypothetical protein